MTGATASSEDAMKERWSSASVALHWFAAAPVSYTHLTLPTNREV